MPHDNHCPLTFLAQHYISCIILSTSLACPFSLILDMYSDGAAMFNQRVNQCCTTHKDQMRSDRKPRCAWAKKTGKHPKTEHEEVFKYGQKKTKTIYRCSLVPFSVRAVYYLSTQACCRSRCRLRCSVGRAGRWSNTHPCKRRWWIWKTSGRRGSGSGRSEEFPGFRRRSLTNEKRRQQKRMRKYSLTD